MYLQNSSFKKKEVPLIQLLTASISGGLMVFAGYYLLNNRNYVVNKDSTLGSVIKIAAGAKQ